MPQKLDLRGGVGIKNTVLSLTKYYQPAINGDALKLSFGMPLFSSKKKIADRAIDILKGPLTGKTIVDVIVDNNKVNIITE